jgi:hypothetical protein
MDKYQVLKELNFGDQVAENENDSLERYFVETDQWEKLIDGKADIVYGPKGSGKSALYSLLLKRKNELESRSIFIIAAENVRGRPVFKGLVEDPPTSERQFINLWKLFFLTLIGGILIEGKIKNHPAERIIEELRKAQLLAEPNALSRLLRTVLDYVRAVDSFNPVSVDVDPVSNTMSGFTLGKIVFREPSAQNQKDGFISVDSLFELAEEAMSLAGKRVWILLDRLDVAFSETLDLETNALRALFRVYNDIRGFSNIKLKIFIRTDVWNRITLDKGFREASHFTSKIQISWDNPSLLDLTVRRIVQNGEFCNIYNLIPSNVLSSPTAKNSLFYRLFPDQVVSGKNLKTFDWFVSRTKDGTGYSAPREIIHLLNSARDAQLKRMEQGEQFLENETLFSRTAISDALTEVSTVRLQQTLYAEYPEIRRYIEKLNGEKTQHTLVTLGTIWGTDKTQTEEIATELVKVGFFEDRGTKGTPIFWVPFLYRDALNMIRGNAE